MKTLLLALSGVLFTFYTQALSITTQKVAGNPFCGGDSVKVHFHVNMPANAGNVFTAQLSDKHGNFDNPINIGSWVGTTSGIVHAQIPVGQRSGTGYKIRIVSSDPVVLGDPTPNKLKINPPPGNITLTDVTACAATLSWTASDNAVSYKIRYKEGTNPWSAALDIGNILTFTFSGLDAGTNYTFQVRSVCETGDKSDWRAQDTTTLPCLTPEGLHVTSVGSASATLEWDDVSCSTHYVVIYRILGSITWDTLLTSTSQKTLTSLAPGTDYEAQVATLCGLVPSPFSSSVTWETGLVRLGNNNELSNLLSVFPNPNNGTFVLKFNNDNNEPVSIRVQNVFGQAVFEKMVEAGKGLNETSIALTNAASGLYLVEVKSGKDIFNSTVVIK